MRRREFIQLFINAMIAAPCSATAQADSKVYRLATIGAGSRLDANSLLGSVLIRTLAQRGYALGRNLSFEPHGTPGEVARLPQVAKELAASKIDAVVALGYPPAVAAKTAGLPTVVAGGAGDPVASGLVDSLSRPGGSITGISDVASTLSTKRLGLLKEAAPTIQKVAMLWNKDDLGMTLRYEASAKVAAELGISVQPLGVREPNDFDEAFAAMNREPPDAILMVSDSLTNLNRRRVFEYADARKLPAIYENDPYVRDGGLMSYGADLTESYERAASMVARIFGGAVPGELPFEQPTRYLFVINLKAANSIGFKFSPTLLALADEVIE